MSEFLHNWGAVVFVALMIVSYAGYLWWEVRRDDRLLRHLDRLDDHDR